MARNNRKFPGLSVMPMLALIGFVGAAAVAFYFTGGSKKAEQPKPQRPISIKPPVVTQVSEWRYVRVFVPKSDGGKVYLVPVSVKTEVKGNIMDIALRALIREGTTDGDYAGLIPNGTRILAPITIRQGVATVNLSKEFVENFSGGSDQEALTLNSIVHTLVRNSGGKVEKVRLLVEGETVETLGGHFDLTEPIEADSTLLRPDNAN